MAEVSLAQQERRTLSDLLVELGPEAPTLCEGWSTADMAAHLVVRERRPDSGPGLVLPSLAAYTDRVRNAARESTPYTDLIARVRSGPPMLLRPFDGAMNTVEFFIHVEDLRRGQDGWEPRAISPLISRLRMRPSEKLDVEWDFDLDTGAKKFTSNNMLVDLHEGNYFSGLSYARLNAPGRFYTEGVTSSVSNFSQLRFLLGYGGPLKPGLGVAVNMGLDLRSEVNNSGLVQYGALQTSYNWNCCGLSVEVRKYELGAVRNETVERFNFTLVNIGTAGNLRRAESLF